MELTEDRAREGLPISTVVVTLRRMRLNRLKNLEPPRPVIRYEKSPPGELLHIDTKKLGRISRIGHRINQDRGTRIRGVGWEHYQCVRGRRDPAGVPRGPAG